MRVHKHRLCRVLAHGVCNKITGNLHFIQPVKTARPERGNVFKLPRPISDNALAGQELAHSPQHKHKGRRISVDDHNARPCIAIQGQKRQRAFRQQALYRSKRQQTRHVHSMHDTAMLPQFLKIQPRGLAQSCGRGKKTDNIRRAYRLCIARLVPVQQ